MEMLLSVIFLVFVGSAAGANITVAFENAHYRGHYLAINGTLGAVRNPPVSDTQRWRIDWDLIFLDRGSQIASRFNGFQAATTAVEGVLVLAASSATPTPMRLRHRVSSNRYLYRIEMLAATGGTVVGCVYDTGLVPIVTNVGNCTDTNMKAWWNIYTT